MESDEHVVTLIVSDLEETEFDAYANTSDEEIDLDDLAVNEAINDDSATLTARSEIDSSNSETDWSADKSLSFSLRTFKPPTHFIAGYKGYKKFFLFIFG